MQILETIKTDLLKERVEFATAAIEKILDGWETSTCLSFELHGGQTRTELTVGTFKDRNYACLVGMSRTRQQRHTCFALDQITVR